MTDVMVSLWNDAECRRAHTATLAILEDPGVEVRNERARDLLAAAGRRRRRHEGADLGSTRRSRDGERA